MTSDKNDCCIGFLGLLTFVLGIGMIILIAIPTMKYDEFNSHDCSVTHVNYPTQLPTSNNTNGWLSCNCGRYCKSYSPCIDVYVSIDNSTDSYKTLEYYLTKKTECTFYEKTCKGGENILDIEARLQNTIDFAQQYIGKNLTCYTNNNYNPVYLEQELNIVGMILISIAFVCSCLLLTCNCVGKCNILK